MRQCGSWWNAYGSTVRGYWRTESSLLPGRDYCSPEGSTKGVGYYRSLGLTSHSLASCLETCPLTTRFHMAEVLTKMNQGGHLAWSANNWTRSPEGISRAETASLGCLSKNISWLLIDVGGPRPLPLCPSPELCKKGSWATSLHSSCPCSCLHSYSLS